MSLTQKRLNNANRKLLYNTRRYGSVDNTNINNNNDWRNLIKRMKLTNKQKRSVKRRVDLDQGVRPPGTRVFVSKKIYTRKLKHKKNEERK